MSFASPRRHRASRTNTLHLPPNLFARSYDTARRPDVLLRVAAFIFAVLILWLVTGAGTPPFSYRRGDVPQRKIIGRVNFQREDDAETEKRKEETQRTAPAVYENDSRLLEEKRQELTNKVGRLVQAESFDGVQAKPELKEIWSELSPPLMRSDEEERQRFDALRTYFTAGMDSNRFDEAIKRALSPLEKSGLLKELKHKPEEGSQINLLVYSAGNKRQTHEVLVDEVRIDKVKPALRQRLEAQLKAQGGMAANAAVVAELVYAWLDNRLPETLRQDQNASLEERARAVAAGRPVMVDYKAGIAELAPGGKPLDAAEVELLRLEYDTWIAQLAARDILSRSFATLGMYLALAILCGFYIYHRRPALLTDFRQYATLLTAVVVAVSLGWLFSEDNFRAE